MKSRECICLSVALSMSMSMHFLLTSPVPLLYCREYRDPCGEVVAYTRNICRWVSGFFFFFLVALSRSEWKHEGEHGVGESRPCPDV